MNKTLEKQLKKFSKLMEKYELNNGDWNIIDGFSPLEDLLIDFYHEIRKAERDETIEMIEKMGSPINTVSELKRADVLIDVINKIKKLK